MDKPYDIAEDQYTLLNNAIVEYNKYIMCNMALILGYNDWLLHSNNPSGVSNQTEYKFYIADKINLLFSFPDWFLHTKGKLIPDEWVLYISDPHEGVN